MAYRWIFFLLSVFLFSISASAQTDGSFAAGTTLTSGDNSGPWLSPTGDFAFGFKQQENKDQFLFSIWFNKIPDQTVAWYPNTINPVVVRGSLVRVDSSAGLILLDPQNRELWRAEGIGIPTSQGFMNDTGNFILKGNDGSWLWQSFQVYADTMLPGQNLDIGSALNSRQSETNFSNGRFYLRFLSEGNLVLTSKVVAQNSDDGVEYYSSATSDSGDSSNSGFRAVFDSRGSIFVLRRNNKTEQLTPVSADVSGSYLRATLEFDGVFALYSHPRSFSGTNSSWDVVWSEPNNICTGLTESDSIGACGYNSICSIQDQNKRPICDCLIGYTLADPNSKYGDCKPNFILSCDGQQTSDLVMLQETNVDWPFSDYRHIDPATETVCNQSCFEDCFCAVSIFRDNQCWKKKLPLSNGKRDASLGSTAFIKSASSGSSDVNVAVGTTQIADGTSNSWLSPSGDFVFGFRQLQDKDQFMLAVWYNKVPDKTLVWFLDKVNPIPRGSSIQVDSQRGLVLLDPRNQTVLWFPDSINNTITHHGFMSDTGNFILKGSDSVTWETFRFATDTILPSQELVTGTSLNSLNGRFYLRFLDNGNLVLTSKTVPENSGDGAVYYTSNSSDAANSTNSGSRLVFDERGLIYMRRTSNQTMQLSPNQSSGNYYYRATLEFDGVFILYSHPRSFTGNPKWTNIWSLPDNICMDLIDEKGTGACGYNSICSLEEKRPVCKCPKGYDLVDPNDKFGNCKPNFSPGCDRVKESDLRILEDDDVDWPESDYQLMNNATETVCRQSCLEDCLCSVAIFRNNNCWKKKLPLSNGRRNATVNSKAFIKFNLKRANNSELKRTRTLKIVLSVLLGFSLFLNFYFTGASCLGFDVMKWKKKKNTQPSTAAAHTNLRCFTFKELAEATDEFKEELGRGSFGVVYKGVLENSFVAVKKLNRLAQEKEFRAELNSIGKTNHKNLVHLLGFCDEGQDRLLVYEYMSNGSLASFIFSENKSSWSMRKQIALGIAKGLVYLHEECSIQIIHCDIKPQNVLLDDSYNVRISDFGLAKLLEINQSKTSLTHVRGTRGYVAPEWFRNNQITAKVDVYSFGVLLLEIVSCRKSVQGIQMGEENWVMPLADMVWECFQDKMLDSLVGNDVEALNDSVGLERYVMVGLWCIQENPSLRPTMRRVSQMLEGIVHVHIPPRPYPLSSIMP